MPISLTEALKRAIFRLGLLVGMMSVLVVIVALILRLCLALLPTMVRILRTCLRLLVRLIFMGIGIQRSVLLVKYGLISLLVLTA